MPKVLFKYGTRADYDALKGNILENALYFLTDTGEILRGSVNLTKNHYYDGEVAKGETDLQVINRVMTGKTAVQDDVFLVKKTIIEGQVTVVPYMYTGLQWLPLSGAQAASEVVLDSDIQVGEVTVAAKGATLSSVLATVFTQMRNAKVAINEDSLEMSEGNVLNLKNFGKQYYRFVPQEGETEAHYELQAVDASHAWAAGLELRTALEGGKVTLGWYEPNPTTIEGLHSQVGTLQTSVDDLKNTVQGLSSAFQFKGSVASVDELPNTDLRNGDVYQVGDKEYVYNGTDWVELGFNVDLSTYATTEYVNGQVADLQTLINKKIELVKVNGTALEIAENDKSVNIPLFGTSTAGLVPQTTEAVASNKYYLTAIGTWAQPADSRVGELTIDGQAYDTVENYVAAAVEKAQPNWSNI